MPGHVIVLIGAKGGTGKSVIAGNLAVALQRECNLPTLLIESDPKSLNDLSLLHGIKPGKLLHEVASMPSVFEPKSIPVLLPANAQGVSFIGLQPEQKIEIPGLGKQITALKNYFQYIVVDAGNDLNSLSGFWMGQSTFTTIVANPEVVSLNCGLRMITQIQTSLYPSECVSILLNKITSTNPIKPESVQKKLDRALLGALPFDMDSVDQGTSRGQMLVVNFPKSSFSRSVLDLARNIHTQRPLSQWQAVVKPKDLFSDRPVEGVGRPGSGSSSQGLRVVSKTALENPNQWVELKLRILEKLVNETDITKNITSDSKNPSARATLEEKAKKLIADLLQAEPLSMQVLKSPEDRSAISKEVFDEALGFGPLEDLLNDPEVKEIMVNGPFQIYMEKGGKVQMSKVTFSSEHQVRQVIERIVTPLGRRVNEQSPYVDARLPDGSRVHAVIPPIALNGSTITIRKFPKFRLNKDDLLKWGTLTSQIADFLRLCIENRLNIVIAGGTGSGKTTLLNILSNFIPANERIITVEDAAELQLGQPHVIRLETKPKSIEGTGEVTIRDLVKQTLRMRPDRIIVGECRGGEALDMLQAMNTGHDGSMTTVHANTPRDAIARLETLTMMSGMELPVKAIREQISSAVHLIVQQSRLSDGSRKITHITEVCGMQGDIVSLADIFVFKEEGFDRQRKVIGRFVATGTIPKFVEELNKRGITVNRSIFSNQAA